jgi:hypothetical protein
LPQESSALPRESSALPRESSALPRESSAPWTAECWAGKEEAAEVEEVSTVPSSRRGRAE